MYLTRFQVNPRRRGAHRLLASPQAMHAAILSCFPDPRPTDRGRVLWRVDTSAYKTLLYMVSPQRPDLTTLVEQAGWPTLETWETRAYGGLLERISDGQLWGFRLTANPVKSLRTRGAGSRGTITPLTDKAEQAQWLIGRAGRHGFALSDEQDAQNQTPPVVRVSDSRLVRFEREKQRVTLNIVTYDGVLKVTNRESFRQTLSHGLGRAKGYGCGLLTIAPLS